MTAARVTGSTREEDSSRPNEAIVAIERIAFGGDGVGRWPDGRTAFVPRTAPGDSVRARLVSEKRRYLRAHPLEVVTPGPGRTEPACPHYQGDNCGGCRLQHLDYQTQLAAKGSFVGDALRRIGKVQVADPEVTAAPEQWRYRSRIRLAASGRALGYHSWDDPRRVFDLDRCHIASDEVDRMWQALSSHRQLLPAGLKSVEVRQGESTAPGCLVLEATRIPGTRRAQRLAEALEVVGVPVAIWCRAADGAVVQLAGPPGPEPTFEQVHRQMGREIISAAVTHLDPSAGDLVWDLYSGAGAGARLMAAAGATVVAVERDRVDPVEDPLVDWRTGLVEHIVQELPDPDLVLVNPPRSGLAPVAADQLATRSPRRVAYVSCDPATLARDLGRLAGCFELVSLRAYDLFPQTAHVESLAVLERR